MKYLSSIFILLLTFSACSQTEADKSQETAVNQPENSSYSVHKTDEEWKADLSDLEYNVIREKGTERAFTGDLLDNKAEGTYTCRACGHPLFQSDTKFKSGTGWPSFYQGIEGHIEEDVDRTYGMTRTEILCNNCGGHLGHVFEDGPAPTGLRYCVNSASLDFEESPTKE